MRQPPVGTSDTILFNMSRFCGLSTCVMWAGPERIGEEPDLHLGEELTGIDPVKISPFHHVKSNAPPTLLLFGSADGIYAAMVAFTKAMTDAGNRCELNSYAGLSHGFFNLSRDGNAPSAERWKVSTASWRRSAKSRARRRSLASTSSSGR